MDESLDTLGMASDTLVAGSTTGMDSTATAFEDRNKPSEREVDLSFLAPSTRAGSLGRVGEYEILGVLGRGAMGIVLRGYDRALNRTVAVKVQDPSLVLGRRLRAKFLREARAAGAINHPGVVTIYKVNVAQDRPYLAMEYVAGSLRERIRYGGPLEMVEVLRISLQVAEGLAAAHARGVLHRDIKPANILLEDGAQRVKISDFGLAIEGLAVGCAVSPDKVMGTPSYMSPEQARNEPLDARSDLFSLGCVIYAMLSGRSPFRGESPAEALASVLEFHPGPPPELHHRCSGALNTLVMRLLSKDRDDRPSSASTVAAALRLLLAEADPLRSGDTLPPVPGAAGDVEVTPPPAWVWPSLAIASLLLATVAALTLPYVTSGGSTTGGPPAKPEDQGQPPVASAVDWTVGVSLPAERHDLQSALASPSLGPGSTLRLIDDSYSGSIVLSDPIRHRGLTIVSDRGSTLTRPNGEAIVTIRSIPGVTLRGLKFRPGLNRFAVTASGPCAGLTLEANHFQSDPKSVWTQVYLRDGASGLESRPITVARCTFAVSHGGLTLGDESGASVRHVRVEGNRFENDEEQLLVLQAAEDVKVRGNVFLQGKGVILNLNSGQGSGILIANNSFLGTRAWLSAADSSPEQAGILICNNAILRTSSLDADGKLAAMARGTWKVHHNAWEPSGPADLPAESSLASVCPRPGLASYEPGDPKFLCPGPGSPLQTLGAGGDLPAHVGAFAPEDRAAALP